MEGDAPSRDVTRLVNLSDAVVAIAATLLVLPLVDQVDSMPGAAVSDLLDDAGQQFAAFVLSFVVIGRFWLVHQSVFNGVREMTAPLFWLNLVWLIGIVFLPYPTELIGVVASDDRWDSVVYIGTLAVTSLAGLAMQVVIRRTPGLRAPDVAQHDLAPGLVTALVLVLAFALTLAFPAVGLWSLFLLFATAPLIRVLPRGRTAT